MRFTKMISSNPSSFTIELSAITVVAAPNKTAIKTAIEFRITDRTLDNCSCHIVTTYRFIISDPRAKYTTVFFCPIRFIPSPVISTLLCYSTITVSSSFMPSLLNLPARLFSSPIWISRASFPTLSACSLGTTSTPSPSATIRSPG